jgi:hypothetical protein
MITSYSHLSNPQWHQAKMQGTLLHTDDLNQEKNFFGKNWPIVISLKFSYCMIHYFYLGIDHEKSLTEPKFIQIHTLWHYF